MKVAQLSLLFCTLRQHMKLHKPSFSMHSQPQILASLQKSAQKKLSVDAGLRPVLESNTDGDRYCN